MNLFNIARLSMLCHAEKFTFKYNLFVIKNEVNKDDLL